MRKFISFLFCKVGEVEKAHIRRIRTSIKHLTASFDDLEFGYQELIDIETERREILRILKSAQHDSRKILFDYLDGTVFPAVMLSFNMWLNFGIFILIRVCIQNELTRVTSFPVISATYLSSLGGFVSFFIIFLNNQAYTRFMNQYDLCMKIEGRIFDMCLLSRGLLPTHESWRLIRYVNLAHIFAYIGLSPTYGGANCFIPINKSQNLVTEIEMERLDEIGINDGGNCYREILVWAMDIIYQNSKEDSHLRSQLIDQILQLRGCIASLYAYGDQPIPFVYLHGYITMIGLYLPICAYTIAVNVGLGKTDSFIPDLVGSFILFVIIYFMEGVKSISYRIMHPFGDDVTDLSVFFYINYTMVTCRKLITGRVMPPQGLEAETFLEKKRPQKGKGFVNGDMEPLAYYSTFVGKPKDSNTRIRQPHSTTLNKIVPINERNYLSTAQVNFDGGWEAVSGARDRSARCVQDAVKTYSGEVTEAELECNSYSMQH